MYYLFDLDGTLIDSNSIWLDVDTEFLRRRGLPYTKEYYEGVAHSIFPLAAKFTKAYCGIADSEESIMREWLELAGDRYSRWVKLKPHVGEFLSASQASGIPMALVTACVPQHGRAVLEKYALTPYFEHIIFAQELGVEKANPNFYPEVARICGVKLNNFTLFDDSVYSCKTAAALGIHTVGVYDPFFAEDESAMRDCCERYITDFSELLPSPTCT